MHLFYQLVFCVLVQNSLAVDWPPFNDSSVIFPSLPIAFPDSANVACRQDSLLFLESISNLTTWAYEIWDASAKEAQGQLSGDSYNLGDFDLCLKTRKPFRTQYCLVDVRINVPSPSEEIANQVEYDPNGKVFERLQHKTDTYQAARDTAHFGLCIPNSCHYQEVEKKLQFFLNEKINSNKGYGKNVTYTVKILPSYCQNDRHEEKFDAADIGFCAIMAVLLFMFATSSMYYWNATRNTSSIVGRIFRCFSFQENVRQLQRADTDDTQMQVLYTVRFICICCVMIGHKNGIIGSGPLHNQITVENQKLNLFSGLVVHADAAVDTFFTLSGILVTFALLGAYEKFIAPFKILILRYIRITPAYAMVIYYYATIFDKIGAGPYWETMVGGERDACRTSWWTNLLYISNYYMVDKMCMVHSWYLPCDMHMFTVAVFLVILLKKRPKTGLMVIYALMLIGTITIIVSTLWLKEEPILLFSTDFLVDPRHHHHFVSLYSKTHIRFVPYLMGMLMGYVFYIKRGSTYQLSTIKSTLLCYFGFALVFGTLLSSKLFYKPNLEYDATYFATYAALNRVVWTLGTILYIYSLAFGYVPFMSEFMRLKIFIPLSKLSYGAYLIHMSYEFRFVANLQSPIDYSAVDVYMQAIMSVGLTFLTAFFMYFLIETPIRKVFLIFLKPKRKTQNETTVFELHREKILSNKA